MALTKKDILVFAHWQGFNEPRHMATLTVTPARGKETFAFEYTPAWLKSGFSQMLDPDLQLYSGAYYPRIDKSNFGVFLDSCPDRWGRILMQRREAVLAKKENRTPKKLLESDFLRFGHACKKWLAVPATHQEYACNFHATGCGI